MCHHHKPYNAKSYIFVIDSMNLVSVDLMQLAPKAAVFSEITSDDGYWAVQGHRFWYRLPIESQYGTYY